MCKRTYENQIFIINNIFRKKSFKKKKSLKMESSVVSTRATHGTTFPRIPCCGYYASLPGYVSTVKRNWDAEMCFL